MDGVGFDALTRALTDGRPRRGLFQLLLGLSAGGTLAFAKSSEVEAKECGPCRKKTKSGKCRKVRDGTRCRRTGFCKDGECRDCKPNRQRCTDDFQCCSGVCDRYDNRCKNKREACDPTIEGQCGESGICCPSDITEPTGHRCFHDPMNNLTACGTKCDDVENCLSMTGTGACQNGKCCCVEGPCMKSTGETVPPCEL